MNEDRKKQRSQLLLMLLLITLFAYFILGVYVYHKSTHQGHHSVVGFVKSQVKVVAKLVLPRDTRSRIIHAVREYRQPAGSDTLERPGGPGMGADGNRSSGFSLPAVSNFVISSLSNAFGIRYAIVTIKSNLADVQPTVFPSEMISNEKLNALNKKIDDFDDAISQGKTPGTLALTATEINALIAHRPELKDWKRRIYFTIEKNEITAQFGMPFYFFDDSDPRFQGLYLNGLARVKLHFSDDRLHVFPLFVQIKGKAAPSFLMKRIGKIDFGSLVGRNPLAKARLTRLENIEVKNAKVYITPKSGNTLF